MEFKDIVNYIPQLFILFIPGYIAIGLSNHYRQEIKLDDKRMFINSVICSFILDKILYTVVLFFKSVPILYTYGWKYLYYIYEKGDLVDKKNNMYITLMLVVALIAGYVLSFYPDTKISTWIDTRLFKSNIEPYTTVWNYIMKQPNGVWVKVYMKESNIMYIGALSKYTSDPNIVSREILLSGYNSYKFIDDEYEIVDEYINDQLKYVWISEVNINRIELSN